MKRTIEILGILFVFTVFCPFVAGDITSGNAYQAENGDNSFQWSGEVEGQPLNYSYNYSYEHCDVCSGPQEACNSYSYNYGEEHAFKWEGSAEDQPLQYRYQYSCKNGEEDEVDLSGEPGDMLTNSYKYAYAYGVPEDEPLGEMFNYAFSNQGAEQGPFERMNMTSLCQPDDRPVGNDSVDINPQPLPEPGTMLLLGLGGAVMFSKRKR